MKAHFPAAANHPDIANWLTGYLGWELTDDNPHALVVIAGWQSSFDTTKQVTAAHWQQRPVYRVARTNDGFRLEHVLVDEHTLAMLHTAHANGYAVNAA